MSHRLFRRMEQPLKCFRLLSLEEIALRKLVATLWNSSDILFSIHKFRELESGRGEWRSIIDKIKDKIMKLELPESLTKQMVDVVRPIGVEIRKWKDFHEKTFNLSCIEIFEHDSAKLCFTTAGTVDDRRMAQEIVRCSKINVVQRYRVACSYWLEDCIPILWKELTEEDKEYFSQKNRILVGLQFSWPHIFKDGQSNLDCFLRKSGRNLTSFNQWAFEHSAQRGYETTAEYFFQKLSYEEMEASLMRSARQAGRTANSWVANVSKRYSNVLLYLLSLMTPEQQIEIVEELPVIVFSCFLDWPRQRDLFSENIGLIYSRLPERQYRFLLRMVQYRVVIWDNYFPEFFSEFFKQCPLHFKKYFVNQDWGAYGLLYIFFARQDTESIKVLFRNLDAADRVKLLFNVNVPHLFYHKMSRGKWPLVELCLQEATLSEKQRKRLSTTFRSFLNTDFHAKRHLALFGLNPPLTFFFDFLNKPSSTAEKKKKGQKRKLEDCALE